LAGVLKVPWNNVTNLKKFVWIYLGVFATQTPLANWENKIKWWELNNHHCLVKPRIITQVGVITILRTKNHARSQWKLLNIYLCIALWKSW
jgi:hypothetical protein